MMMVLGLYVFMLRTVPYQELQYQRSWRHAANSRVNRRPSTQFLGPENDMLTLSGVLMPEITGGRLSLLALEQMAEQGKAWPLIEGSGTPRCKVLQASISKIRLEGVFARDSELLAGRVSKRIRACRHIVHPSCNLRFAST